MSGVELHEAVRTPVAARLAGPRRREAPRRLNVGCGDDLLPDYVNLDMAALPGVDVVHDLERMPWPFEDGRFEEVRAINVLEHLRDTVRTMEELWRITRAGARVVIRVPNWNCGQAAADPTHVARFHPRTFHFFDPDRDECRTRPYYTCARFRLRRLDYWSPLVPLGAGRGWVRITNPVAKAALAAAATFLCNIIWVLEAELETLKPAGRDSIAQRGGGQRAPREEGSP